MISRKIISGAAIFAAVLFVGHLPQNSNAQTQSVPADNSAASGALPTDIQPNSPLAQVIRLAQSGVEESVLLAYVNNSASTFNLTPDQIIYLKDLGVPNDVVTAMIQRDQQLGATANPSPETTATAQTETSPADVTQNYFYDTLSPYGGWVNVDGYGLCWRPTVVVYDSSWQPYCDHGHWVYTDSGWYWLSDYSWGATAFHYGRWFHDARFGWCWWPDTVWAPSWVCWRYSDDYCGWAPLPPRTVYQEGAGFFYNGVAVSAGFDFGLSVNFFTFVPTQNFCDPHPRRYRAAPAEVTKIYNHTTIINNFNINSHDRTIINNGIPPARISAVTHVEIPRFNIHESSAAVPRGEQLGRDTLVVNRPHIQKNAGSTLNQGIKPTAIRPNTPRPLIINGNENNSAPHAGVPQQNHPSQPDQKNFEPQISRPVQPSVPPASHSLQPEQTPNDDYNQRLMSPRDQQQSEERTPRVVTPDSQSREIQAAPVEHPQNTERHDDLHQNSNPSEPQPKDSTPPAPQKSDKDQNPNGPGH
jgi:hypothetical protein